MRRSLLVLALAAAPAAAQQQQSAPANVAVSASRAHWQNAHTVIARAAEQVPESLYSYRPAPTVRTFGELLGHVADAEYLFCGMVIAPANVSGSVEKTRTKKAELVQALRESGAYCERAYAISDADAAGSTNVFGQPQTKLYALTFNAIHDWEHYGNIVTYMRMLGMVPPTSQR